jgi:hypothetical protein
MLLALAGLSLLAGCATPSLAEPAPPAPVVPPLPDTRVFVYPAAGQSPATLERDQYECHLWAVRQTGFDPSAPEVAPHARVQVVPVPATGANTLAGAATGAIIGATVSRPRDAGAGAMIGAVAGALLGSSADQAEARQAAAAQSHFNSVHGRAMQAQEQRASDYRRALTACLQGRSYTIQ